MMKWLPVVLTLLSCLTLPVAAAAETKAPALTDRAREAYEDGILLSRAGDHQSAIARLRAAKALSKHPRVSFDLALAHAAADDPVAAIEEMKLALRGRLSLDEETVAKAREVIAEQAALTGVVILESPTKGARVRVNGREVGTTPLSAPISVRAGLTDIELTAPGRAPAFMTVEVKAGFQKNVELSLDKPGSAVPLNVSSKLPEAEILVDGERRGDTRSTDLIYVTPGKHEVTVQRLGYTSATKTVMAAPGGKVAVDLDPVPDPEALREHHGTLVVDSVPPGAVILLDGRPVKAGELEVAPGLHDLAFTKAGYLDLRRRVAVDEGGREVLKVELPPTAGQREAKLAEAESDNAAVWAFGALGIGLTIGGISVMAFGIVRVGETKQEEEDVRNSTACQFEEPTCQTAIEDAEAKQGVATGLAIGGAGGLALGLGSFALSVYLFLNSDDPDALEVKVPTETGGVTLRPDVSVSPWGSHVGLAGTF
ncbi:MAG: PEGA domain-containing protein [Myxococcales bacterium]|nr:PEGA domain-containing protein [Myxococcales bacterium]